MPVAGTLKSLLVKLGVDAANYYKDMDAAERQADKLTKELTTMAKVGGAAFLGVSAAGGAFLVSATKLAARVETLGVTVKTLGKNADYTEGELKGIENQIKSQGITTQNTLQSMAQMIQANIDLAEGADLARIAQNNAVIAGINSSEAFQRLVTVLQTGNVLMGRAMGLTLDFAGAQKDLADSLDKTVEQLSDAEVMQARLNEVKKAGVAIEGAYDAAMGTVGKTMLSLDRLVEDSRLVFGNVYIPMLETVVNSATKVLKSFEALHPAQQAQIAGAVGGATAFSGLVGAGLMVVGMLPKITAGLQLLGVASATALGPIALVVTALGAIGIAAVAQSTKMRKAGEDVKGFARDAMQAGRGYEEYRKQVVAYADEAGIAIRKHGEIASDVYPVIARWIRNTSNEIEILTGYEYLMMSAHEGMHSDWAEMDKHYAETGSLLVGITRDTAEYTTTLDALQASLGDLADMISIDVGRTFEEYQDTVRDLTAEIEALEGKSYLTKAQKQDLEGLRDELEQTEQAWDRYTKELLFNLAQQTAAIDGFTQDELAMLTRLGGPEGLGLYNAATETLMTKTNLVMSSMSDGIFTAEELGGAYDWLYDMMLDPIVGAEALARAIESIKSKDVSVTVTTYYKNVGTVIGELGLRGAAQVAAQAAATSKGFATWAEGIAAGYKYVGGQWVKKQYGGSGIVPPGFPGDTYPILLSSGERYHVTSPSQTRIEDAQELALLQEIADKPYLDEVRLSRLVRDAVLQAVG